MRSAAFSTHVGYVISFILVTVAVTPLALAVTAVSRGDGNHNWLTVVAAVIWLVLVVAYRSLAGARERQRRRLLGVEISEAREARCWDNETFRASLADLDAAFRRISAVSRKIAHDGITDPQLTINQVGHIASVARDAQDLIEETVLGVNAATENHTAVIEAVDLRREIAEIAGRFSEPAVSTVGARLFAATDARMFGVILRNLIAAARERGAGEIDVSVTRNGGTIVCCVSDNGTVAGASEVPPLIESLARALGTRIEHTRLMGWNQLSFGVPQADSPGSADTNVPPLDVLGARVPSSETASGRDTRQPRAPIGKITFPNPAERNYLRQSVADRRKGELTTR